MADGRFNDVHRNLSRQRRSEFPGLGREVQPVRVHGGDEEFRRRAAERFLQGPQRREFELARAVRIFFEMMRGFRTFHFVGPCVTVFGSARFKEAHPFYAMAREVGVPPWKLRVVRDQSRAWSDAGIARAVRTVAQADADIKGAASDASYTLERLVLTISALRTPR